MVAAPSHAVTAPKASGLRTDVLSTGTALNYPLGLDIRDVGLELILLALVGSVILVMQRHLISRWSPRARIFQPWGCLRRSATLC